MSLIEESLATWKARLSELEERIAPLASEAQELRDAIAKLEGAGKAPKSRPKAGRAAPKRSLGTGRSRTAGGSPRAGGATKPAASTGREQNRDRILTAIRSEAKTAGQVASETGLGRASVSTALTKLVTEGVAVKAPRGYKAT